MSISSFEVSRVLDSETHDMSILPNVPSMSESPSFEQSTLTYIFHQG